MRADQPGPPAPSGHEPGPAPAHESQLRVIYGDTDQMGVVYYANYLRYFESGRGEYIRAHGLAYRDLEGEEDLLLPVVAAQVQYHRPARYDDLLTLQTRLTSIGRASVRFDYRVLRDGVELATGHTVHACVGRDGKVKRFPSALRARLGLGDPRPSGG